MPGALGVGVSDAVGIQDRMGQLAGIRLDIGCGRNKQEGWFGIDFQSLPGVDLVWDLTRFPWPLPDQCAIIAQASHVVEHIPPFAPDARLLGLIRLLLDKGAISPDEVASHIGRVDSTPMFVGFMNEVWRVMKPGGQFVIVAPHGRSDGFIQDPTHINMLNETTFVYFMKEHPFWQFYQPKPWRLVGNLLHYDPTANIEVVLEKDDE